MPKDKLSDEDKALFREAMKSVKPLTKPAKKESERPSHLPLRPTKKEDTMSPPPFYLSNAYTKEVMAETILSFGKERLPAERFHQLKKGQIPWEARLDLHGLRLSAARDALYYFIREHHHAGRRSLLIIHGKGSYHGEPPVLKNNVNHWLQQIPEILAFHSALPRDGGAGALYVLLKRSR